MSRRFFKDAIFLLIIFLIVSFYFLNLFYPKLQFFATPDFGLSDLWMFYMPLKFFLSLKLKENVLPFWSKDIGNGFPILAEVNIGAFYPTNLFLFKFFPFPVAFNLMYPIIFLTSAIGTFLFCRSISLSRFSSFYTSIVFSFSGYYIAHLTHPGLIQTISLLPWMFFFTHKVFKEEKRLYMVLLAITIALSFFSGYPQITFISLIGISLFVIFLSLSTQRKKAKNQYISIYHPLICFTLAIAIGIFIASIQIFPSLEFLKVSERAHGFSLSGSTYYSYPPIHLLAFIDPFAFGNPAKGTYPHFVTFDGSIFWENTGYVGIIPIILLILSLFIIKKNRLIVFFWFILIISALLMFGKHSPIMNIYSLPIFSLFRVPSRFLILFIWAISMLAGIYINYLGAYIKHRHSLIYYFLIPSIILISFLNIFFVWNKYHAFAPAADLLSDPESAKFIKQNNTQGRILTLDDASAWNNIFFSTGWQETKPYFFLRNSLKQNLNILFGVPQIFVYTGNNLERNNSFNELISAGISITTNREIIMEPYAIKLLKLKSVRNIVAQFLLDENQFEKNKTVKSSDERLPDFSIYQQQPLDRAFIVYKKIIARKESLQKILVSNTFNPEKEVILEKDDKKILSGYEGKPPKVDIVIDMDEVIKLKISNNPTPGYLVLSDSYYPGWEAYLNNKKTEILAANLTQRSIFLPAGTHEVIFQYKPTSFLIGKYVTFFSIIILVILSSFLYRRKIKV